MRKPLQFVLDFFTGGDPEPLQVPLTRIDSAEPHESAVSPVATHTANPAPSPAPLGGYTHPAANRHAQLQGFAVSYRFERSRRRSIGFVIGGEGLVVRAPSWVTLREVDAAVQEKSAWIVAKLQQLRQRQSEHVQQAIDWTHGAHIPYLGGTVRLCVVKRGEAPPPSSDLAQELRLSLPPGASAQQVREAAEVWFKKKARPLFEERLTHFAPLLGVQWQKLSLSSARTRWGSARIDGHIRLNWRLSHLPLSQIDYVVVHELAHLREMNHSPRFWDTVGGIMPDYRERRQQLRQSALGVPED
jgi:predicted metal-dependent hydrolase